MAADTFPEYSDLNEAVEDIGARLEWDEQEVLWIHYRDRREALRFASVGWTLVRLCRGHDPLPGLRGEERIANAYRLHAARYLMERLGLTEGMRGQAEYVDGCGLSDSTVDAVLDGVYLDNGEPTIDGDLSWGAEEAEDGRTFWLNDITEPGYHEGERIECGSMKVRFGPATTTTTTTTTNTTGDTDAE